MSDLRGLELFAGSGGLALGIHRAGIQHQALVEIHTEACQTLSHNYGSERVISQPVQTINFSELGQIDVISGGPPCQPFSIGGKHQGQQDKRDMFPYACKAIATLKPKAFIFENVKGLLRQSFREYFEYILLRLTYPEVFVTPSDNWVYQFEQLKLIQKNGSYTGAKYNVRYQLLDAADYGIPQRRERVIIVGFRDDLKVRWSFPKPSYSLDALLWSQFVSGEYWERHQIEPYHLEQLDLRLQKRILKIKSQFTLFPPPLQPWKTVRDAIGDLPYPDLDGQFHPEHILKNGAKMYPGHTGSYLDLPSKALKAGDHGVPGGENMIRYRNDRVRYYTTLEAKRIQTFPDDYRILGSWTEAMRQIGNAVPVELGYCIARSLVQAIAKQPPITTSKAS